MFAGHETTANTLSWCVYELARQPALLHRLQKDIDAVMRAAGAQSVTQLGYKDIKKVKLLDKVPVGHTSSDVV